MVFKLNTKKKILNPTIVVAFPGFGLVGVIATEFLTTHMAVSKIGRYWFEQLPASIAIHEGRMIDPVGVFYNEKSNVILVHSISAATGIEWEAANIVKEIADLTKAKEIICLDGVGIAQDVESTGKIFIYSSEEKAKKKFENLKLEPLKESIVLGMAPALLLKSDIPVIALFAETQSNLPDSKAAAKLIKVLDDYLGLKVDSTPLLETAVKFEEKLKKMVAQNQKAADEQEKKKLSYVG